MKLVHLAALVVGASLAVVACNNQGSGASGTATGTTATAAATAAGGGGGAVDGKEIFKTRCAPCHGETGKGDGPGAAALTPKPRDYTNAAWQDSVKDEDIKKTILYGGAAVGKSAAMPASPDLDGKPDLDALVKYVRSFKGK